MSLQRQFLFLIVKSHWLIFIDSLLDVLVGNIFICQCPSKSAATGEGESEEEDEASTSAGVIYKIGIF